MINPLRSLLVPGSGTQILGAANALGARIAESIGGAEHMLTTYPSRRAHVGFYAWMQLQKRY